MFPPGRWTRLLLLLAAAALLCAATAVAAVPAVTSVACAGGASSWCSTGALVTLTGTDLPTTGNTTVLVGTTWVQQINVTCTSVNIVGATTLTCTLTAANGFDGSFPVVLRNTVHGVATDTYVGDLLVGAFYEQTAAALPLWSRPPANGVMDVSEVLTGIDGDGSINTGNKFTMYGNFSTDGVYKLYLYNAQAAMVTDSPGLPTCSNAGALTVAYTGRGTSLPNTLVCTSLTTKTRAMGMYGFLVYNTATSRYVYGGGLLYLLSVNPPNATVTSVAASCADGSASCSSGVSLTLTGTNINVRTPPKGSKWDHFVNFTVNANPNGLQPDHSITCTTTAVSSSADSTTTTATLSLAMDRDILPGTYPLYVVNQVCNMGMKAPPVWVGNVVVGLGGSVSTGAPWEAPSSNTDTSGSYVTGAAPQKVQTGSQLTLYGTYTVTTATRYEVRFVDGRTQTLQSSSTTPACTDVTVTSTALRCTYTAKGAGASSALAPMVYDAMTGAYLQSRLLLSGEYAGLTFEGTSKSGKEKKGVENPAAVACAVVFAVLFLAAIIAIIVMTCCCSVSRRRPVTAVQDLEFQEMQRRTKEDYSNAPQFGRN